MANFCGKCGTPVDPATGLCPTCNPVVAPSPAAAEKSNKPKSKKKALIAIVAIVLVVAIVAGGAVFVLPRLFGSKDEYITAGRDGLLFSNDYGEFYMSTKGIVNTKDNGDLCPENIVYDYDGEETSDIIRLNNKSVVVGNTIYAQVIGDMRFYKIDFTGNKINNAEIWLDDDEFDIFPEYTLPCIYDWQYSDGYIYFYVAYNLEYAHVAQNNLFKLMRINVETKELEEVSNKASVVSYVIDGDWIYYADNGYDRESNDTSIDAYNSGEAGIYRMKTDGSKREKLMGSTFDGQYYDSNYSYQEPFSRLSIYKDKLYFIDNSDVYDSRLYCMDLDGDNVEKISDKATYEYTIDLDTGKLYYVTGSYYRTIDEVKYIYEVSLEDYDNDKIAEYAIGGDRILLSSKGGKLSLHSPDQLFGDGDNWEGSKDDPCVAGLCIDTNNDKIEVLYSYCTKHIENVDTGRGGIITTEIIDGYFYYWDDYNGDLLVLK